MPICLFNVHHDPLLHFRVVVRVVHFQLDSKRASSSLLTNSIVPFTRTVSPMPGMKKIRPTWGLSVMFR